MVEGIVNLASPLAHEAPPDGVLTSFETYALARDKVRCEERGQIQIRGIAQSVTTYAVIELKEDVEPAGTELLRLNWKFACPMTGARLRRMHCVAHLDCSTQAAKYSPDIALSDHSNSDPVASCGRFRRRR